MEIFKKFSVEVWFLLLLVVGYTIISAFAVPFNIENSRLFAIPYRILIFGLSIFIIYKNFTLKKAKNVAVISIVLFWILYLIKSFYSFTVDEYDSFFKQQFFEIYLRIFVIALIPSVALLFINYKKIDFSFLCKAFFYILTVMLSFNLIYALIIPHRIQIHFIFSTYYIFYGHLGATLVFLSLFYLFFKSKEISSYFIFYGLLLGLTTIAIAGARSPFLAIMVVIPYLLILKKSYRLIFTFLALLLLFVIFIYLFGQNDQYQFMFLDRTYLWLFKGDNSLRTPLFEHGIEIFKSNPVFGGRTHYKNGMYPHNLFLELLMATGVIGLILYFMKFIPVIKNLKLFTYRIENSYYILFFTLFLQYFVLVGTSFTLYSVPEFLYFSSIIIGISINELNEENESDDGRRDPSGNY